MSLLADTDACMLRKLSKNFDDCDHHPEYNKDLRQKDLDKHFKRVINALKTLDLRLDVPASNKALAAVYLLYKELLADGPWKNKKFEICAERMDLELERKYAVKVGDLLKKDHCFDRQGIFDEMMYRLHLKLTAREFKQYPSLIKVYFSIFMKEIEEYIVVPSVVMLPISLYLIDDYILEHKKSGLSCSINILRTLDMTAFAEGNYYEVIYASLKKAFTEKNIDVTKSTTSALCELIRIMRDHADFYRTICEELLDMTLEQIQTESCLPRRAVLFQFLTYLIHKIGVNCVNRQSFQVTICNNLEISCQPGIEEVILLPVMEVLEAWIRYCWCAWDHKTGVSIIASLFKVLCSCRNEEVAQRVINVLAAIYSFSPQIEKDKFENGQAQIETFVALTKDDCKRKRFALLRSYVATTKQARSNMNENNY